MNEQESLSFTDPQKMLLEMRGIASDRKLRLFACACCRRIWMRWGEAEAPEDVEISERFADGDVSREKLRASRRRLGARGGYSAAWAANCAQFAVLEEQADDAANQAIVSALSFAFQFNYEKTFDKEKALAVREDERKQLTAIVLEIFGNPFQQEYAHHAWLKSNDDTIPRLAHAIYDERAFDRLPMFADALEEAGCMNADILSHCRQSGEHVRGCWVVDLILGKR